MCINAPLHLFDAAQFTLITLLENSILRFLYLDFKLVNLQHLFIENCKRV